MTKVSLEADIRMEERRKKSRGENLEDRQMKRYMRYELLTKIFLWTLYLKL